MIKIGLKARFSDMDEVMKLKPDLVELHFSDKDADYNFKPKVNYDIPCVIHLPEFYDGHLIDLAAINQENQVLPLLESIRIVQEIINKSEKFFKFFKNEKNVFILHPGGASYETDPPQNKNIRLETLIKSLELIKTENSEILVENLPPLPWYFGGQWNTNVFMDAEQIDQFCRATHRKVCYDASHSKLYCNYSGKDFFSQMEIFKKHMTHLHIGDAEGTDGEGLQIDEGGIGFPEFFSRLKGYDGYIVPEIWMGYTNGFTGFKIALERIRKYLNKDSGK